MPALVIVAAKVLHNRTMVNIMSRVALIWISTLILSVTINELIAPLCGIDANYGIIGIYFVIVAISFY